MTFFTFQRLIHAHSTLFVLQVKTISTLVKLNTFCVFLSGSSKSYVFNVQVCLNQATVCVYSIEYAVIRLMFSCALTLRNCDRANLPRVLARNCEHRRGNS